MQKEQRDFLQLFHPQPGYKLLEVTTQAGTLTRLLHTFLQPYHGRLAVALYPGEHDLPTPSDSLKIHTVDSFSKPFRALPRDNDIVILNDLLDHHAFPERILKAVYTTLANTGEVIIMAPKGSMDIEALMILLEKTEYRAANQIQVFEDFDLVMAKKMHMWGNGL
jgi:hypothetical protein